MVDEALLRYYAHEWDGYPTSANCVNRLFVTFNRRWVKVERNGGKNVYEVYKVRSTVVFMDWRALLTFLR
jgi:hypothetical protein